MHTECIQWECAYPKSHVEKMTLLWPFNVFYSIFFMPFCFCCILHTLLWVKPIISILPIFNSFKNHIIIIMNSYMQISISLVDFIINEIIFWRKKNVLLAIYKFNCVWVEKHEKKREGKREDDLIELQLNPYYLFYWYYFCIVCPL